MGNRASSIEKATGVEWSVWTAWFEAQGAVTMDHSQIAQLAEQHIHELSITTHAANGKPFNTGWWAHGIAIEFEQDHGLRVEGQEATGSLAVSASKTLTGTLDETLERWLTLIEGRTSFGGVDLAAEPSVTSTEKWRYWRARLEDGTAVSVDISAKKVAGGAPSKSVLGISHAKLDSAEAGVPWRAHWKSLLTEL